MVSKKTTKKDTEGFDKIVLELTKDYVDYKNKIKYNRKLDLLNSILVATFLLFVIVSPSYGSLIGNVIMLVILVVFNTIINYMKR